jgi:hypothetical protein
MNILFSQYFVAISQKTHRVSISDYGLLLFMKIVAFVSESHMKQINSLCEQTTELLNVKTGDA